MSFDYRKHKSGDDQGSMWTSYSDLFLGLSIIFLLLYVTASLRQGTDGVQQAQELQRVTRQVEDLQQQIRVYDTLKKDYLQTDATSDEQQTYKELMDKLSLLKEEAKDEKNQLRAHALENEKKENALNKYQQVIRNIINSNMVASARIKRRDVIIEKKDDVIAGDQKEIAGLEHSVAEEKQQITARESTIAQTQIRLDSRIKQLQSAYRLQKITKKKFEQQAASARAESLGKVAELRAENQKAEVQLSASNERLAATNSQLSSTESALAKTQGSLNHAGAEKARLSGEIAGLKGQFENQRAKDRAAFDGALNAEKLSGAAREAREAGFRAESDRKAGELADQIGGLNAKMRSTEGQLAKAQENLNARKKVAEQIKKNFAAKGVKAEVDAGTGDVMLSFGDHYFETNRADLKREMADILQKAMPAYSASLFEDHAIAEKIQSVEIVGFASPTYKGKYIDPGSLNQGDRGAVNYNLDLSFARARSIFNYVFDTDKITFKHQKDLLPLVKVTGRSFLAESKKGRAPASPAPECDRDCVRRSQRVIIKFTLKD